MLLRLMTLAAIAAAQETNWYFWHSDFGQLGPQPAFIFNDDSGCTMSFFTADSTDINSSGACVIDEDVSVDFYLANG